MSNTEIGDVVAYLNEHFNQDSEEYSIFCGAKPQIIRYNNETAISLWGCGAIVCIGSLVFFICEDDGNWFNNEGRQEPFSMAWGDSFINAFNLLKEYVEKNGKPYYYHLGTDDNGNTIYSENVCGYRLE